VDVSLSMAVMGVIANFETYLAGVAGGTKARPENYSLAAKVSGMV
jgi:hypothetical protein